MDDYTGIEPMLNANAGYQERDEKRELLARDVSLALERQGFRVTKNNIEPPEALDKKTLRRLHETAVEHNRNKAAKHLARCEPDLLRNIAAGSEVVPEKIQPHLVEVKSRSKSEILFRYACLHWSIPISSGYGRRLRFLVRDVHNGKLMGLIGLGDPVFALGPRDKWIGWNKEDRRQRLQHVMNAFVLGAAPPYSNLLGGKLIGMLAASNEVREAFHRKYANRRSVIRGRPLGGNLALVTTTSALGRSSIYNRLNLSDRRLFISCGYTSGSGDFHFSNGTYSRLSEFVNAYCEPTAKNSLWGRGFRNRREIIRKGLGELGLSTGWSYHGIAREMFVVPVAENAQSFLRGDTNMLEPLDLPACRLFDWFRVRWLLPRSGRDKGWQDFDPETWRLWGSHNV